MKANHLFWKFIYYLIVRDNARIIDVSPDQKRIWIEYDSNGKNTVIRMARVEYDWMKDIQDDMTEAKQTFKRVRRMLPGRQFTFYNIYVSTYPPVDLYEPLSSYTSEDNMHQLFMGEDPLHLVTDTPEKALNSIGSILEWESIKDSLTDHEHKQFSAVYRRETLRKQESLENKDRSLLFYGKTHVTYLLLGVIIIMYYLLEKAGGSTDILTLIDYGAKYNPAILEGQWWRLVSSMFLHIGFIHLFMNSLALFYLGTAVERMYGSIRFLIIYFVAGLFGSLASFAFNEQVSAGASGAIFGCFGALLYFGLIHRKLFFRTMGFNVLLILAINLSFGFMVPAVDNGAHIGGLAGGFLASAAVHLPRHGWRIRQLAMLLLIFLLAGGVYYIGLINDQKSTVPAIDLQVAQDHLENNNVKEAEEIIREILAEQENAQARFLLGNILVQQDKIIEAEVQYEKAVSLNENFPEAYYNLTIVYIELDKVEKAKEAFEQLKAASTRDDEQLDMEKLQSLLQEKTNE